jgi:hypothetical protein
MIIAALGNLLFPPPPSPPPIGGLFERILIVIAFCDPGKPHAPSRKQSLRTREPIQSAKRT